MSVTALPPVAIGVRVHALREAQSLSLRDLAERSGVSAPMLSQVERGDTSPTLAVAARIAAGLELRLSQLLRLDEDGAVSVVHRDERRTGARTGAGGSPPAPARRPPPAPRTAALPRPPPRPCPGSGPRSRATSSRRARGRAAPAPRPCTSPARARPPWSSTAGPSSSATS